MNAQLGRINWIEQFLTDVETSLLDMAELEVTRAEHYSKTQSSTLVKNGLAPSQPAKCKQSAYKTGLTEYGYQRPTGGECHWIARKI